MIEFRPINLGNTAVMLIGRPVVSVLMKLPVPWGPENPPDKAYVQSHAMPVMKYLVMEGFIPEKTSNPINVEIALQHAEE